MKRIKAWLLTALIVLSLAGSLAGCVAVRADSALTMGQWLTMLADSFGLATYTQQEPFFEKVSSTNSYFSVFQACAEWDIIEPSDTVSENTPLTWNDVLISLVNAGEFMALEASDKEKVAYAIEHFDSSIRTYWGGRYIEMSDAAALLQTAADQWINFRYEETIVVLSVTDDVKDFLDTELEYTLDPVTDTVTADGNALADLKPGDVYTLPGTDSANASINRVASIEIVDGKTVIVNDDSFTQEEALEYIEEFQYEDSSPVDFTQLAGIYDENGNPIDFTVNPNEDLLADDGNGGAYLAPLTASSRDNVGATQLGIFDYVKGTLEFKVPDKKNKGVNWVVKLTIKASSITVRFSREKKISDSQKREVEQEIYAQASFSNMNITRDVDYAWGKLNSATMKLSYKTEIEGGAVFKKTEAIGKENLVPDSWKDYGISGLKKDVKSAIEQYKHALDTAEDPWRDGSKDKSDSIYICRLSLLGNKKGVGLDFVIKGEVTFSGEVKIVITLEGASGIEYKNGKIRYVKKNTTDADFMAEGKLEAALVPGFELRLLDKILVADVYCKVGAGVSFNVTTHLLDAEGHRLYSGSANLSAEASEAFAEYGGLVLTGSELQEYLISQGIVWDSQEEVPTQITFAPGFCFEFRIYPVLVVGGGGKGSLVGKLLSKFGIEAEKKFLEDFVIFGGHFDFSQGSNPIDFQLKLFKEMKCTLKNKPWPEDGSFMEDDATAPETTENNDYMGADDIELADVRRFMRVGEQQYLEIIGLPSGYTLEDLEVVIEDTDVVKFDAEFSKLVAVGEGTTQIIIRTKDKEYHVDMAITVSSSDDGGGSR